MFAIEDLFVVGLALDVTGAVILARGLLVNAAMIGRASATYWDWNATDAVERVHSRVDGEFGVAALGGGFVVQGAGYVSLLAGASSGPTGLCAVFTGVGLMSLAALVTALAYHRVRPRRARSVLVAVALAHKGSGGEGDEDTAVWTKRKLQKLASYGRASGIDPRDIEEEQDPARYVERVFGVTVGECFRDAASALKPG